MNYVRNRLKGLLSLALLWLLSGHISVMALSNSEYLTLGSEQQGWKVLICPENGTIKEYQEQVGDAWEIISFREDSLAGPVWKGVGLLPLQNRPYSFGASRGHIDYQISYKSASDHLIVECMISNKGKETFQPECTRLCLGVNSEMTSFPDWDTKFFPTLLRCEKDFAWGYFMSPRQIILGFGVEEPVASYAMNYKYEGLLEWKWGHQIYTASLDMLHRLPLPERHPQNLVSLAPGESKTWTLHLGGIPNLVEVKKKLSQWIKAPMIECERYTLLSGECTPVTIFTEDKLVNLSVETSNGEWGSLKTKRIGKGKYVASFSSPLEKGVYCIKATAANGKTAEAQVYVRNPWSWYLKNARDFVAKNPPLFSNSCEAFYGYYTAFIAARHFPDARKDKMLEDRFNRTLNQFIDTVTWVPREGSLPDRVQNFSSLIGMLVDLWEATGRISYLDKASHVADYICSERLQSADGAYRSHGVHYTAVIYPAKSMLELVAAEKQLVDQPVWKERYERHKASADRAVADLLKRLDDIQTEGDMTFEDGMISCSALQIALQGLSQTNVTGSEKYAKGAAYLMNKHQCLEQLLIPDCRMRGATLRYWEALDVYFVPNQVMNSPHGWTGWKIYASYYLYLLTGEVHYLTDFMDTLGACAQIMDLNGHLRWAFIPDPFIKGQVCLEREDKKHHWHPVDSIVGEQYLDMISPWLRPDNEDMLCTFGERGGSGDNTVQEIFKVMEECALTSAYVYVDKEGEVRSWNCTAFLRNGVLKITPNEDIICGIHLNTVIPVNVFATIKGKPLQQENCNGMLWLGTKPELIK